MMNKIIINSLRETISIISFIATAAPVLVFDVRYKKINEKPITRVFVAPIKNKNPSLFVFEIMFPIIAACPLPNPGRKPHKGEAIIEPNKGLIIFIFGLTIS